MTASHSVDHFLSIIVEAGEFVLRDMVESNVTFAHAVEHGDSGHCDI